MTLAIIAVAAVTLGTVGIGVWGVRFARTTSELYVASRAISPWWNAAAVSGEYLSAASFLGIAGLEMQIGVPALWQAVGFAAGYLALLLFVAAPLRASPSGRSWGRRIGRGSVVVGVVVSVYVALGGMRGVSYVQAFQFWVKTVTIALPAIVLLIYLGGIPNRGTVFGAEQPHAPRAGLVVQLHEPELVRFPAATRFEAAGHSEYARSGEKVDLPPGRVALPAGADVPLPAGTPAQSGSDWARPVTSRGEGSPLYIYSLLLATFLGTMGLPHILVRFYTNPDGPAARQTTVRVLALLSVFYLFPAVYGALGRALAPGLYLTGQTDTVVLTLPAIAWPGTGGNVLAAMTAAGAFAAFMSTSSGLLISIAGTISHDVWGRGRRPASLAVRRRRFRIVAALGMAGPALLALAAQNIDISIMVGWAFALAASTFCPLFLLGIWWSRLTAQGAAAGIVVGGVLAIGAILAGALVDAQGAGGAVNALLTQPAIVTVPVSFAAMIMVSLVTAGPKDVRSQMLALHAPEGLGLEALERVRA